MRLWTFVCNNLKNRQALMKDIQTKETSKSQGKWTSGNTDHWEDEHKPMTWSSLGILMPSSSQGNLEPKLVARIYYTRGNSRAISTFIKNSKPWKQNVATWLRKDCSLRNKKTSRNSPPRANCIITFTLFFFLIK